MDAWKSTYVEIPSHKLNTTYFTAKVLETSARDAAVHLTDRKKLKMMSAIQDIHTTHQTGSPY